MLEIGIADGVESRAEREMKRFRTSEKCEARRAFQKVSGMERAQSELSSSSWKLAFSRRLSLSLLPLFCYPHPRFFLPLVR